MKLIAILLSALAIALALPACDSKKSGPGDGHTDHTH